MGKNEMIIEMKTEELATINGGLAGVIIGVASLTAALFAFGYQVGSDRAEMDNK